MSSNRINVILKANLNNEMAQAILKLFETNQHLTVKLIIFLFVIATSCLSSFLTIQSCLSYLSFEVITTTRTIPEVPTIFPKITFCNLNPFTHSNSIEFFKDLNENSDENLSYKEKYGLWHGLYNKGLVNMNKLRFTNFTLIKHLSHNFEDILLSCRFNQNSCNVSDFQFVFDKSFGNCYVFNSIAPLKTSQFAGSGYRLELEIYVNFHENLTRLNAYGIGRGGIVRIENNSYLSDDSNEIYVSPGEYTFIKVDRFFKYSLPKPYSECDIDNEGTVEKQYLNSKLYNLINASGYVYRQQFCFNQCYQMMLVEECNCTDWFMVSLFEREICTNTTQIACSERVFGEKYLNHKISKQTCSPLCPLECNLVQYRTHLSTSQLIDEKYLDYIKSNRNLTSDFVRRTLDSNEAKESFSKIGIIYDSLSYEISTESPKMDVVSALANIGGNLGLFMGVSIFSICEIIEALIAIAFSKWRKH